MNGLTGTARLTRLGLQRDRISLPVWIVGLAGLTAAMTGMSANGLRSEPDLLQETQLMATNPAMRLLGLASGASIGGYTLIRGYLTLAVLAALMSIFAVVRHTRQGEETGRAELVGAAVVGRHAGLTAALVLTLGANVGLAIAIGLAMSATGQPVGGSFVAGAAVSAVGVAFAGFAAITTQLSSSTRGASGLAAAMLGLSFLASGVGNMAGHVDASGVRVVSAWPAWLSPIGWGQQMRPFGGDHWWPLALFALLFSASVGLASYLAAHRDIGQGLLAQRRGRVHASATLRGPIGLAWRLQRSTLLAWAVAMLGFGLVLGAIIGQVTELGGAAAEWYSRMGGSDQIVDAFRASMMQMAGMAAAIYVVQVLLRMRGDESGGQLEPVLAASVSRPRWVLSYLTNAGLGASGLLLLFALGMGLTAGGVLGDTAGELRVLAAAALVQLPGILVLGAAVVLATGLLPRAAGTLAWGLLAAAILTGPLFGDTLRLPQWVKDFSPFTHVPKVPAVPLTTAPVLALVGVAATFVAVGLVRLRRRNLALPV
ncbi:MAG: ABC transporter permease [Micromonosporaceae bacterium]